MYFELTSTDAAHLLRLCGGEPQNVLTRARVLALTECIESLAARTPARPLIIAGNQHFFSAGADLKEIAALSGPEAYAFGAMGQRLMRAVADFPAPTFAAVEGWCMGGGFDLALACQSRVCSAHAI
ncbi:MAG TPA: enoyl-CoA hydratase/isomerase family protein, partial [Terriglobales bacterium]